MMKKTFSSSECAEAIKLATGKEFSDGKIRVWKQRGHMPYLDMKFGDDQPKGMVKEHVQQLALQSELTELGINPAFAGGIAYMFNPVAITHGAAIHKKNRCLLGIGFFADGTIGYTSNYSLAAFDLQGVWGNRYIVSDDGKIEEDRESPENKGWVHPVYRKERPRKLIVIDALDLIKRVQATLTHLFPEEAE
jgi:hypothetical protein